MAAPLRVIQWATGSIGTHAIPAILEDPDLELVGVWVHSEAKDGRDAGEIIGIGPIGVTATRDIDALLALDADLVLYAPLLANVPEICRLLEAGLNVITPAGWSYLKDGPEKDAARPVVDARPGGMPALMGYQPAPDDAGGCCRAGSAGERADQHDLD